MAEFVIECLDVVPERYGAGPTLLFRLRINELTGQRIHAIAMRCQMRFEPARRPYTDDEAALLLDVFGERSRWSDTLKPMQFAHAAIMVPSFDGSVDVEVPVPASYDLEVATGKYLHALTGEPVPMVMMFSGTVFGKSDSGFWVEQVPWHLETRYGLPVTVWRDLMDAYFPQSGWLRLHRETLDSLLRFKAARGLATWDDVMRELVSEVGGMSERSELIDVAACVRPAERGHA
jgi:hypothetical protein